jgi:DnaJ-class molecular chaperone
MKQTQYPITPELIAAVAEAAAQEEVCKNCNGSKGYIVQGIPNSEWVNCSPCHGTGKVAKIPGLVKDTDHAS